MNLKIQFALFFMVACFVNVSAQDLKRLDSPEPLIDSTTDPEPTTTISFEEMTYDFGTILQGSVNEKVFRFQNTGDIPLILTKAKGSCGCTVPYYPLDPIMPGEWSEIQVTYKPGKQKLDQAKTVTIYANTEPVTTLIRISAFVEESDLAVEESIILLEEQHTRDRDAIDVVSPGCFVIYPNPTTNELKLDLKEHIGRSADVAIFSESGAQVFTTKIETIASESSRLDVSNFTKGIYIINVSIEGQKPVSQCFVVER